MSYYGSYRTIGYRTIGELQRDTDEWYRRRLIWSQDYKAKPPEQPEEEVEEEEVEWSQPTPLLPEYRGDICWAYCGALNTPVTYKGKPYTIDKVTSDGNYAVLKDINDLEGLAVLTEQLSLETKVRCQEWLMATVVARWDAHIALVQEKLEDKRKHLKYECSDRPTRARLGLDNSWVDERIQYLKEYIEGCEREILEYRELQRPAQEWINKVNAEVKANRHEEEEMIEAISWLKEEEQADYKAALNTPVYYEGKQYRIVEVADSSVLLREVGGSAKEIAVPSERLSLDTKARCRRWVAGVIAYREKWPT